MSYRIAVLGIAILSGLFVAAKSPISVANDSDDEGAYVQVGLASIERGERLHAEETAWGSKDNPLPALALVEELTRLYEVTKVAAARTQLLQILSEFEVSTRYGFSHDGMLVASITRMELMNSVFDDYTMFLVNVENRSGQDLPVDTWELQLGLKDEATVSLEALTKQHPLYSSLSRMEMSFRPPTTLRGGAIASFKIIASRPGLTPPKLAFFRLSPDSRQIVVKFYENLR